MTDIPALIELPTDRVRPVEQCFTCGSVSVPLSAAAVEALKALGHREGTTLFCVLLAALNVLLLRYTNQDDVCVGVPIAGRSQVETEGLIGLFVNTLVIRTDMFGTPGAETFLRRFASPSWMPIPTRICPSKK